MHASASSLFRLINEAVRAGIHVSDLETTLIFCQDKVNWGR